MVLSSSVPPCLVSVTVLFGFSWESRNKLNNQWQCKGSLLANAALFHCSVIYETACFISLKKLNLALLRTNKLSLQESPDYPYKATNEEEKWIFNPPKKQNWYLVFGRAFASFCETAHLIQFVTKHSTQLWRKTRSKILLGCNERATGFLFDGDAGAAWVTMRGVCERLRNVSPF